MSDVSSGVGESRSVAVGYVALWTQDWLVYIPLAVFTAITSIVVITQDVYNIKRRHDRYRWPGRLENRLLLRLLLLFYWFLPWLSAVLILGYLWTDVQYLKDWVAGPGWLCLPDGRNLENTV